MSKPSNSLTKLPATAMAAFAQESARVASIKALMDAIQATEAELQQSLHMQVARITMVGQILQVQKSALAHGKIGDWFTVNFGKERMKTMMRWAAVGEAVTQECPELAQRTGQLLLAQSNSADELAAVGESVLSEIGVDSLTRLYKWAAEVRNPPRKKRTSKPAPLTPERKAAKELADLTAHLGDLKQVLHLLATPKVKAVLGRLAEENPNGFAALRDQLTDQWAVFAAALKGIKVTR